MSTRCNLSAGSAGSTNSRVNVNLNTAGGNKKQGIPPHNKDNWANRAIQEKSNGTAYGRTLIYTENQLGGVGAGRSMFKIGGKNAPDGVFSKAPYSYGENTDKTVNDDLTVYGNIRATGDITADIDIYANNILYTNRIEPISETPVYIGLSSSSMINNGTLISNGLITANAGLTVDSEQSITCNSFVSSSNTTIISKEDSTITIGDADSTVTILGTLDLSDITFEAITANGLITANAGLTGTFLNLSGDIECEAITANLYQNADDTASISTTGVIKGTSLTVTGGVTCATFDSSYIVVENENHNISIGNASLNNNSGDYNTAVGYSSLYGNSGGFNTGLGNSSLNGNSGVSNTGVGSDSLNGNSGGYNTGLGDSSLYDNSGDANTGVGSESLNGNIGSYNTGVGYSSLMNNIGSYNTGLGYNAGHDNNYSNCTFIGYGASTATGDNQIIIGTEDNTVYIPGSINKLQVGGEFGTGTPFRLVILGTVEGGSGSGTVSIPGAPTTGSNPIVFAQVNVNNTTTPYSININPISVSAFNWAKLYWIGTGFGNPTAEGFNYIAIWL